MARMYSRKKGKSGSKKPVQKIAVFVKYKPKEIEDIIVKLAKQGHSSAKIGLILRDQYGVPSVKISKLKIAQVMKKHELYPKLPEDLINLIKKAINLDKHLKRNKKDRLTKRGLELTEGKIRRLGKYYKKKKILAQDWKFDIEKAKILIR